MGKKKSRSSQESTRSRSTQQPCLGEFVSPAHLSKTASNSPAHQVQAVLLASPSVFYVIFSVQRVWRILHRLAPSLPSASCYRLRLAGLISCYNSSAAASLLPHGDVSGLSALPPYGYGTRRLITPPPPFAVYRRGSGTQQGAV